MPCVVVWWASSPSHLRVGRLWRMCVSIGALCVVAVPNFALAIIRDFFLGRTVGGTVLGSASVSLFGWPAMRL